MNSRTLYGTKVTTAVEEIAPGSGWFNPAFDLIREDGIAHRLVISTRKMTRTRAAQMAERCLLHAIAVDKEGIFWF